MKYVLKDFDLYFQFFVLSVRRNHFLKLYFDAKGQMFYTRKMFQMKS